MELRQWLHLLSNEDRAILERAKFGRHMGFGQKPAVVVIDVQYYMTGDRPEPIAVSNKTFPSSCGERGWVAVEAIGKLLDAARARGVPIFYTSFVLRPDGADMGAYRRKRDLLQSENWCLEGTFGAQIVSEIAPLEGDIAFVKKKPSAFWGTPLLGYLVDRQVDTLLITGGSTSNCVRATVFDAVSYNFRPVVVEECVFDRIQISHQVSLFDMDRQFADVVKLRTALDYLANYPLIGSF